MQANEPGPDNMEKGEPDVKSKPLPWYKRKVTISLIVLLLLAILGVVGFLIWNFVSKRFEEVSTRDGVAWFDKSSKKMEVEYFDGTKSVYIFADFETKTGIAVFTESNPSGSSEVCVSFANNLDWLEQLEMKGERRMVRAPPRRRSIPANCYFGSHIDSVNQTRFKTQLYAGCYVTGYLTGDIPYEACCTISQRLWFFGSIEYTKCINVCEVALAVVCATLNICGIPCPPGVVEAVGSLCPKTRYATAYWDKDWSGGAYRLACTNRCNNVRKDWNDKISSIQTNSVPTVVFEHSDCRGASLVIPGEVSNLRNIKRGGDNWNDVVSSYRCG